MKQQLLNSSILSPIPHFFHGDILYTTTFQNWKCLLTVLLKHNCWWFPELRCVKIYDQIKIAALIRKELLPSTWVFRSAQRRKFQDVKVSRVTLESIWGVLVKLNRATNFYNHLAAKKQKHSFSFRCTSNETSRTTWNPEM